MGKIRTRPQPPPPPSPEAIVVDRPSKVTTPVLRVLKEILGNNSIKFDEIVLANDEIKFELSGSASKGTAREKYSVFLLDQVGTELLWLGGALIFKRELLVYRLKSISILIFKGEAFDERKTALLRAEWDNPESGAMHAQPHWHVYPRFIGKPEEGSRFEEEASVSVFAPSEDAPKYEAQDSEWPTSADFHYAMASTWQTNGINFHQEKLNDLDYLLNWLRGCIVYTREQLVWLFS
jgi:hypothetical protein